MNKSNMLQKKGDRLFQKSEKVVSHCHPQSIELMTLTYGTFVARLLKENDNADDVNYQLEQIGYRIGRRVIDEFLAKSETLAC